LQPNQHRHSPPMPAQPLLRRLHVNLEPDSRLRGRVSGSFF
jgi:hypothetical protein